MSAKTQTAMDSFEQPVSILPQIAIFLVVLHHVRNDSPAAASEGIAADFGSVFDADTVVEARFSLCQTVQCSEVAVCAHASSERVLTPSRDESKGTGEQNLPGIVSG